MKRATPLLLLLVLIAATAAAYIPPGSFILRKMGGKLAPLRGINASFIGSFFDESGAQSLSGRLYLASPDRFRLEASALRAALPEASALRAPALPEAPKRVEVWAGGSRSLRVGESAKTEGARTAHPLPALFLSGNAQSALRDRGVETGLVSLARFGENICWVVGAKPGDLSRPQLWVEKDTFFPIRLLLYEGEGETRRPVEYLFLEYDPTDLARPFPRKVEHWRDGKRVWRIVLQDLRVTEVPPDSLFSTQSAGR